MTLPVNVDTCTVTGAFVTAEGTAPTGTVTFTPVPAHLLDATATPPTTILGTPIVATVTAGAFEVDVPATDDDDLNPVDWAYHVAVRLGADAAYSFCMAAPAGTVDLATVTPITSTTGDVIVAGPPGEPGAAGEGVPPGGATGTMLVKASGDDYDTEWTAPAGAAALAAHIADSTAVHGIADTTDLETSDGAQARVDLHVNDTSGAHAATAISYSGSTTISATTVETALDELDTEKAAKTMFVGGTSGQILAKASATNYDTTWIDPAAGGVPSARTISTTAPLAGGGDLSANRTLTVDSFAGSTAGAVPTSVGGTTDFLRADGSWAAPPGSFAGVGNTATFSYNTTTSEPPTGNQLRLNSTTFTAATRLWVSQTTVDGLDVGIGLARILAGHQIYFQDRDDASHWVKYNVTADGVDDGTYYDFTITYNSGPGAIPAGQVELQAIAPGTVGVPPGGTTGQALTKDTATDYDVSWTTLTKSDVGLGNVDNTADTAKPVSTATQTALDLKANLAQTINAQTGTTYTLVLADAGKLVTLTNAAAITLTVPLNSSVAIPVGSSVDLAQLGAGQVTVAATGGVTVNATPGLRCRAQYSAATLVKLATDTWLLVGDLAAS